MTMSNILYKLLYLFPNSFPNSCANIYRNHWALSAVNPETQIVYHMDPLKRRIADEEWIEVVDKLVL